MAAAVAGEAPPRPGWSLTAAGPALAVLAALVLARLWVAASTDFAADEAYYWLWSRHPALSYYDHPPMVAWWIGAGTALFGHSVAAVRSMAVLSSVLGSAVLYALAMVLFRDRQAALVAVLWTNVMPLVGAGAVVITPDTPMLLFWTLGTLALALVWRTGRAAWWYLFGVAVGLALLSKYVGFFLGAGAGLWLLLSAEMRPWLRRREPWLAGLLALLLFSPVIVWNAQHGWVSFAKQFGRVGAGSADAGMRYVWEFLGGQLGLASPLIGLFAAAGIAVALWRGLARRQPEWLLLALTSAPMLLFFLHHALADRVQANWPGAAYPAAILAAVAAFGESPRPMLREAFRVAPWVGLAMSAVLYLQAATGLLPVPARLDPTGRLAGWSELAAAADAAARDAGAAYVVTSDYGLNALLRFYLPDRLVFQANQAIRYTDEPPVDPARLAGGPGLYIASARKDQIDSLRASFGQVEPLGPVQRTRSGAPIEAFRLYRLSGYRGGLTD